MFFRAQESSRDVNPIHLMFDDERACLARSRDNDRSLPLFIKDFCFHLFSFHTIIYTFVILFDIFCLNRNIFQALWRWFHRIEMCGMVLRSIWCEIWKSEISEHQPPGKRKITCRNHFTHIDLACSTIEWDDSSIGAEFFNSKAHHHHIHTVSTSNMWITKWEKITVRATKKNKYYKSRKKNRNRKWFKWMFVVKNWNQ